MIKKIKAYFEEVYNELLQKTTWPTWKELQSSAVVVMIASVIIALMVFVMDFSFDFVLKNVYEKLF
ncbi:MAG: preprotein translocase subunit SecE [Cytophagaceae bacterium]|jgi:preprotein translocase subunit SecE|nr:preprotein translocase subunit SecE [Cytophagaceae bacterium]